MDVDSTVQEANIAYPADSVLMKKLCESRQAVEQSARIEVKCLWARSNSQLLAFPAGDPKTYVKPTPTVVPYQALSDDTRIPSRLRL